MSDHDPFDGVYETSGASPQVEVPPSEAQAAPAPTTAQPAAGEQPSKHRETYTLGWLRRQDKDDLQAIARDRGLDTTGTRDVLIARIAESQ